MKDQYVGDISDFEKYAILRALASEAELPLAVCWMLTSPDETGEGGRLDYLTEPERYRPLDARIFDGLEAIVESGDRNVAAIERSGILERARFFSRPLEDHLGSRVVYFREVWSALEERSLVFFDPDIGLPGGSVKKGNKRSSMYVFDDELREGFRRGHSLVVFDHWKRVQRLPYLESAFRASFGGDRRTRAVRSLGKRASCLLRPPPAGGRGCAHARGWRHRTPLGAAPLIHESLRLRLSGRVLGAHTGGRDRRSLELRSAPDLS